MATVNRGPCDCCGVMIDCEAEFCCGDTAFPTEATVEFPDCLNFPFAGAGGVKVLSGGGGGGLDCYFQYDLSDGGINYSLLGYHDCDTGETCVVAWMHSPANSVFVAWSTNFSDPTGSVFCGRNYELECHDGVAGHVCSPATIGTPSPGTGVECADECTGPVTASI